MARGLKEEEGLYYLCSEKERGRSAALLDVLLADLRLCFCICKKQVFSLAHLSRRLIGEFIVYLCSGVRHCCCRRRCSPFSNVFSSETAWPIKVKFYVEPPWEEGTKVYINRLGHMTKMATMPIYGKNLKKSSTPELEVL